MRSKPWQIETPGNGRLAGLPKEFVTLLEKVRAWLKRACVRNSQRAAVKALESVDQHRSVDLVENCDADLDDEIRSDSHNVLVECCVMELAEREAIANSGIALPVRNDMSSIEQLLMPQTADSAGLAVSANDALSKACLVQSNELQTGCVLSLEGTVQFGSGFHL